MKYLSPKLVILLVLFSLSLFLSNNFSQATIINKSNATSPNLTNGLVFYHTFDGGDMTAVTSTDRVSSTNNGAIVGTIKKTVGVMGQGVRFPGTNNNYINIPTAYNNINVLTKTISAWFKVDSTNVDGTQPVLSSQAANYYFGLGTGRVLFLSLSINTTTPGQVTFPSTAKYPIGKWFLATAVINQVTANTTTVTWYLNGVFDSINTNAGGGLVTPTSQSWIIGGFGTASLMFNGWVDDMRVYNRALSNAEVMELYKLGGGGKINKSDTTKPTLKTGLVGHWTMDGKDTTSVTTTDKSGNSNDGTRSATGTTAVIGKIGQAMKFSGDAARNVVVTTSASLNITSALTMSAWVKTTDTDGIIINKDDVTTNRQYSLLVQNGALTTYIFQAAATYTNTAVGVVNDGKWHHLLVTVDTTGDGKARAYIDGILGSTAATGITSIMSTARPVWLGDRETSPFPLQGTIDDARIYNRALSAAEVVELYKMGGGKINKTDLVKPDLRSGLVGHWTMDGADMTAVTSTDRSGLGNDGTRTAVTPVLGKIGQAMKFNGSSSLINLGSPASLAFTSTSFSFSAWVKLASASAIITFIGRGTPYLLNGTGWIFVYRGDAGKTIDFYMNNGSGSNIAPSVSVGDISGKWHQVAFTVNRTGNYIFYFDGVFKGQLDASTKNGTIANGNLYIGEYGEALLGYFHGSMDDVRLYNRVLSSAEMMELYRMGK